MHGDYKVDNLIYHRGSPNIVGILNWELSTIGHPLADLVNLLIPYRMEKADENDIGSGAGFVGLAQTTLHGVPTWHEAIGCYVQEAGWDPRPDWQFAEAFSLFRVRINPMRNCT